MLYLNDPSKTILTEYFNTIKNDIVRNINDNNKNKFLNLDAKNFLLSELENIITSNPVDLKQINLIFFQKLNKGILTTKRYNSYIQITNKKANSRSYYEKLFLIVYKRYFKNILKIFDYENILSQNKSRSYWLSKKINTNTCTYCNRLYANTVEIGDGSNDKKRISRPSFDHWYPKSKCPILALSFYNLIPSCSVCNSSIKGSLDFDIDTHFHPYLKETADSFKFSYLQKSLTDHNVIIRDFDSLNAKTKKTINDFKIQEIYDSHSSNELRDLLDLKYRYSDNYIIELFENTFDNLKISEEEIYRLVFGVETEEKNYQKRSLNKFKHDIIEELKKR